MAKWGEGDPRWIVEERADATNVNNWHWTEKNATNWSKDKLKSLLEGLVIKDDKYECKIKELTTIEGEASANNRKAKLIFFYEWVLKGEWNGKALDSDTSYTGNFEIPNLSEENDPDEVDLNVTTKSDKDDAHKVKDFMRKQGQDKVREQIGEYIKGLKTEYSKGLILPTKNDKTNGTVKTTNKQNVAKTELSKPVSAPVQPATVGVKIGCKKLTDKQTFKCRSSELYRAFTEKDMVRAYAGGDSALDVEKGGRFYLFNNNVTGEYTELVPYKKICMRWRFKTWPEEHYSQVTIKIEEKDDSTDLSLTQISVPESDYERTKEGWKRFYWDGFKYKLGFGACLF